MHTATDHTATDMEKIREKMIEHRDKVERLPNKGSVLFFTTARLALGFAGPDPRRLTRPFATSLIHARIFHDADRMGPDQITDLRQTFTNGAGHRAILTDLAVAKRIAIDDLNAAIRTVDAAIEIQAEAERMAAEHDQALLDNAR